MAENLPDAPWATGGNELPDAPWVKPATGEKSPVGPMSWSDVGSQALRNAPGSAVQFGHDIAQPFLHPVETLGNIGDVGHGLAQKLGLSFGEDNPEDIAKADAVGQFFKNRYGSVEGFKRSLANDPVGVAGDLSTILTAGGGAAARLPGIAGRVGEIAGTVGRTVDPLNAATTAGRPLGRLASEVLGTTTGAGSNALEIAARSGYEGGEAGRSFRENMRGHAPMNEVVDESRAAVGQMRRERGNVYREGMADVGADKTIMSWNDVDTAINDMNRVSTYKGQSLSPSTEAIRERITGAIDNWKNLRASEFWTPEGFDALKRQVGDIRDATQYATPERHVADQAYNAIKKTIVDQAPDYARVMHGYEEASGIIKEIEQTLTGKPKANIDSSLRRLQSVLRNNVNTNFGRRAELANYLVNAGAPHLLEKLAGQSLNAWAPRGLARTIAPVMFGTGAYAFAPAALPGLAAASPRLMGEAAHAAGRGARMLRPLRFVPPASRLSRQLGRASENTQ